MGKDINNDNTFMIRFRSSVILMAFTIASIVLGGYVLPAVLFIISLIGMMELYRAVGVHKTVGAAIGYIACTLWYMLLIITEFGLLDKAVDRTQGKAAKLLAIVGGEPAADFFIIVMMLLVILLAVYVIEFPRYNTEQLAVLFLGFFYVAVLLSFVFRIRVLTGGQYSVWLLFVGSWGADTAAYLVGRKWGRHKIVPVLSPKKSLEGFIGGILGAGLIGVIYALIFKSHLIEAGIGSPILTFGVIGTVSAVVSIIGDLAASAIKRDKQIKDYGKLIPGHGGILDRFDSVIIIAPIIYILLVIVSLK